MNEETYYGDGADSSLEMNTSVVGNKVIISAENNGRKPIQFVEYHVLYLDGKGSVVSTDWGYLTDGDNEIKPGASEMRDSSCRKEFTEALVYAHGRVAK